MRCKSREPGGIYYPWHEEHPRTGCCARCGEVISGDRARQHARDVVDHERYRRELADWLEFRRDDPPARRQT